MKLVSIKSINSSVFAFYFFGNLREHSSLTINISDTDAYVPIIVFELGQLKTLL